mgnify:CR=1 FL=1
MKKIVILSAGPGLPDIVKKYGHSSEWIPEHLNDFNLNYTVKKVYDNDLCTLDDGDAWIITGSKYSVYDNYDWIKELVSFTSDLIKNNKPVLGICFGHQVIAKAIGGEVLKNPLGWELGSYKVSLTDDGRSNNLFAGINDNDIVYESHQDIVGNLPTSAKILANTVKSIQSFCYKNSYGVQFHPEFSYNVTRMLMDLRINKGVEVDSDHLEKSTNSHKVLHNFIKIIQGDF